MFKKITATALGLTLLASSASALTFVEDQPPKAPTTQDLLVPVNITDTRVDNPVFDPTDGQEAEIQFTLSTGAYVTITIYDEDRDEVRVLTEDRYFTEGEHSVDWDGEDKYGDIVYDNEYTYSVRAEMDDDSDKDGGTIIVNRGYDNSDNDISAPRLTRVYAAKEDYDPALENNYIVFTLTEEADVKGNIYDSRKLKIYEFIDEDDLQPGTYKVKIDAAEVEDQQNQLHYSLQASNSRGDDEETGVINYEEESNDYTRKPNILGDLVKEHPYTPGVDQLPISFKLDRDADLTVEIRDGDFVVRTVTENTPLSAGSHTIYWDGRDKFGDLASDGIYQYKLIAANFEGRNIEFGNFSVQGGNSTVFTGPKCAGFNDVTASHQYCDAIEWAKNNGIIQGYADGSFKPNTPVKRVEAVKMVLETLNVNLETNNGASLGFDDTYRFAWYANYLKTALSLGVVQGYPDGSFRPENPVLNIESLVVLLNAARSKDGIIIPTANYGQPYFDTPNNAVTQWYLSYAWYAQEHNLTASEYYLYPANYTTRAELADILYRYHQSR